MLNAYLRRINYTGPRQATREVLFALHRAHLTSIPYENLDIHLGERLTLDFEPIYDKIVRRQRGGWCYEMNSLFAWALRQLGFDVQLLSGAVNPINRDEYADRDHLILRVKTIEGDDFIADVGFGNGFLYPLPFREGKHTQGGFTFGLSRIDDDYWHFTNQQYGGAGFVFNLQPYQMPDFAERCHWLQTSPESGFVRMTVCHKVLDDRIFSLRGAQLFTTTPNDMTEHIVQSHDEFVSVLSDIFGLRLPHSAGLWAKIWQKHLAWQQAQP
ncbi:MAG: arylamine N-acetyltransferase [Anaerolineae bacterium]|nr:arylamine N-acetyltransferase [Anaerolineae bacterium]